MRRRSFPSGAWLALALAFVPLLATLLATNKARAYCRSTTCKDCPRDDAGCLIGGTELAWSGRCVALGIHAAGSEQVDFDTVADLTEQSFAIWNAVACPPSGRPPSIELKGTDGPVVCGRSELVGDSANANILIFRDDVWPYTRGDQNLATTTVRSREDGEIVDADIEINGTLPLLTGDATQGGIIVGAHDLLSILTHETGHLLGLDHSMDPDSIMRAELPPRAVRTTLGADDIAAICAAYPPEREAPPCDPTPRGEFSAQCALDPSTGGACSTARVAAESPGHGVDRATWALAILLSLCTRLRLRRRR